MKRSYLYLSRAVLVLWLTAAVTLLTACFEDRAETSSDNLTCEARITALLVNDSEQQRTSMIYSDILSRVARERALDMAERGYFNHTTPEGYGPNYLVRRAGYRLPVYYSTADNGNNIESIAAGYVTPESAWRGWMNSPGHKRHLRGEEPFYREQIEYGVGYAFKPGSEYRHYWVIIIASPGD